MSMYCEHEKWLVYSTSLSPSTIMVYCEACGATGYIENYTQNDWREAFYAPSKSYIWKGKGKVIGIKYRVNDSSGTALLMMDTAEKRRFKDFFAHVKTLPLRIEIMRTGDFLISGERGHLLIERKEISDLASSIPNQLFKEMKQMVDETKGMKVKKLLLVEGPPLEYLLRRKSGWTLGQLFKAIACVVIGWNTNFIFIENKSLTVPILNAFAEYMGKPAEPLKIYGSRVKRSMKSNREHQLFLLEGVPGVGAKTADKWLTHCGSAMNFFIMVSSEKKIPGLGKKRRANIMKILNAKYVPLKVKKKNAK